MKTKKAREIDYQDVVIDDDFPVFTTGVICRILDIPVWTLKQLDKEGIVSPPRESEGQIRLYSKKELGKIKHCWYYIKERRVKITGLKVVLELEREFKEKE